MESETLGLSLKEIPADTFEGTSMMLLGFMAKVGKLLDRHGEIRTNHGLSKSEAKISPIVPGICTMWRAKGIFIETIVVAGWCVVKSCLGIGNIEPDKIKNVRQPYYKVE